MNECECKVLRPHSVASAGRKLEVPFVAVRQGAQDGSYRYI